MEIGIAKGNGNSDIRIESFYGINRGSRPAIGEMEDMENMSSDDFPCISTCGSKEKIVTANGEILKPVAPDSAFTDEITGFTGVSGDAFYYNGVRKTTIMGSRSSNYLSISLPANCDWEIEKMVDMYILNGCDRENGKSYMFYYDIETDTFGYGVKTMPKMIVMVGNDNTGTYIEALRTCAPIRNHVINYSDGTSFNCSDYLTLYNNGGSIITWKENLWAKYFKVGDEITVDGFREKNEGQYFTIESGSASFDMETKDYSRFNTVNIDDLASTAAIGGNRICKMTVSGFSSVTGESSRHKMYIKTYNKSGGEYSYLSMSPDNSPTWCAGITVAVKTPVLNRICCHQGRLWGTSLSGRYIYASASDKIFSFSNADMVDKLAWRMPAETSGVCTAIKSYNGELLIFKEEAISVVSGYNVRNYQVNTIKGIGAISPGSVTVTPRGVIFLSYGGFTVYNGGIPALCGEKLKNKYVSAVSGFDGRKYYAFVTDDKGSRELLVYDMKTNMWHREDSFNVIGFFSFRDGVYCCDKKTVYKLHSNFDNVEWSMTPAKLYGYDLSGINEIWVQAEISPGAEFTVMTKDGGMWHEHKTFTECDGVMIYRTPVRLKRGNTLALKIKGRGRVIIHSLEIVTANGGRRYKERL